MKSSADFLRQDVAARLHHAPQLLHGCGIDFGKKSRAEFLKALNVAKPETINDQILGSAAVKQLVEGYF